MMGGTGLGEASLPAQTLVYEASSRCIFSIAGHYCLVIDYICGIVVSIMALTGKVEIEKEIKASADQFFHIVRRQAHHLPTICSDKIQKIQVHEGDWET